MAFSDCGRFNWVWEYQEPGPLSSRDPLLLLSSVTLPALQRNLVIISSDSPGDLALKTGGDFFFFFVNFEWCPFLRNQSTKSRKIPEQNLEQHSGQKFEKFGELSFWKFSNLMGNVKRHLSRRHLNVLIYF